MAVPPHHLSWAREIKNGKEHVYFPAFVQKFKFIKKEEAKAAYNQLINSYSIRRTRREKLRQSYK
ncbi:hypothetical protein BGZ76_011833, partial [Entomortierella beljakovae]